MIPAKDGTPVHFQVGFMGVDRMKKIKVSAFFVVKSKSRNIALHKHNTLNRS